MIRFLDFSLSVIGLILLSPILLSITIIGFFDTGSPIFFQQRVGRYKKPFTLVKFRTMSIDTLSAASHLTPKSSITSFGHILRKSKLDELPQLWNVLKGDMSLVGARPCLYTQVELIQERDRLGVYNYRPGITGLGQIRKIDMSTPKKLAALDFEMHSRLSFLDYIYYIFITVTGKGRGDVIQ